MLKSEPSACVISANRSVSLVPAGSGRGSLSVAKPAQFCLAIGESVIFTENDSKDSKITTSMYIAKRWQPTTANDSVE